MNILLTSDLHGSLPDLSSYTYDLLLIAGDICPDSWKSKARISHPMTGKDQAEWLNEVFLPWLPDNCYFTWGNHDRAPIDAMDEIAPEVQAHMRVDELLEFGGLKIWFSPWSNAFGWTQA